MLLAMPSGLTPLGLHCNNSRAWKLLFQQCRAGVTCTSLHSFPMDRCSRPRRAACTSPDRLFTLGCNAAAVSGCAAVCQFLYLRCTFHDTLHICNAQSWSCSLQLVCKALLAVACSPDCICSRAGSIHVSQKAGKPEASCSIQQHSKTAESVLPNDLLLDTAFPLSAACPRHLLLPLPFMGGLGILKYQACWQQATGYLVGCCLNGTTFAAFCPRVC